MMKKIIISSSTFIGLAVLWESLAALQMYNIALLPPPSASISALYQLWGSGELASDVGASLSRYIPGFLIGSTIGIVTGLITGISYHTNNVVNPLFHYLRSIPPVALIPFTLVLFGISEVGKISLVAWACFFPVWLNTQTGMSHVPKEYLQAATVFGVKGLRRIVDVWLPCALPHIVSGLRVAVATGLFALAAAEMFAASSGIGFRIVYSHQLFRTDAMVGMILLLGLIALLADVLLSAVNDKVARWESA